MALACGVAVANLYYHQPLLVEIARSFHASSQQVGLVATFTQIGYAAGMLVFLPLADLMDRRRLIVLLLLAVCVALVGAATAPWLWWLVVASFLVGLTTVAPQVVIPFAASLADPKEQGKIIGSMYTGLLLGILLARTVSGTVGGQLGWRTMFWLASGMMVVLAMVLAFRLPKDKPANDHGYLSLMRSLWTLVRTQPELRKAALIGGGIFGAFSAFWTTLVFLLSTPPYHYGSQMAGLFGLVGAAGALVAPLAGRLADRFGHRVVRGVALGVVLGAYGLCWLLGFHLVGLAASVILLDAGVQSAHVCNQTRIFGLLPKAHGRVNTIYMMGFFLGGSVGSFVGIWCWTHWQWNGVCAAGAAMALFALLVHVRGVLAKRSLASAVTTEQDETKTDRATESASWTDTVG